MNNSGSLEAGGVTILVLFAAIASCALGVLMLVSLWRIFTKAGQPGWASIIPIFNTYIKLKISGKPGWWIFLFLVPIVNLVIGILMVLGLARHFGKSGAFAVGMIFLPVIFYPILAFDDSRYIANAD